MKLSFLGSPDGYLKFDKDGYKILTVKPNFDPGDGDLNLFGYFHMRPDTLIQVAGNQDTVLAVGSILELSIKSEVSFKFEIQSQIDLNVMYKLCNQPEGWQVVLSDDQKSLDEFFRLNEEHNSKGSFSEVKEQLG